MKFLPRICGWDAAEVASLDGHDVKSLFRLVFADSPNLKVPELKMPLDTYEEFLRLRWNQHDKRMEKAEFSSGVDWNWTHGAINFLMDASMDTDSIDDDTPVPFLIHRVLGVEVKVPERWGIIKGHVGTVWNIKENWSAESASLQNENAGESFLLIKNFTTVALID
eukprot:7477895-Lingulodinium_polyedra.AAC.1